MAKSLPRNSASIGIDAGKHFDDLVGLFLDEVEIAPRLPSSIVSRNSSTWPACAVTAVIRPLLGRRLWRSGLPFTSG